MKRKSSEHVDHTYGLKSLAKRAKPTIPSGSEVATVREHAGGQKSKFSLKHCVVLLHDIRLELAQQKPKPHSPVAAAASNKASPTPYCVFMSLTDHCILEMFEFLPLADLCVMAEVSVRLKQLAEYFFRVKYGRFLSMKQLMQGTEKIKKENVRRLFQNFGHLITDLRISRKWFYFDLPKQNAFKGQRNLLMLINRYCPTNLKVLTLSHFWINPKMIVELLPIFMRLKTLNYYRLSCYSKTDKMFFHFGYVLAKIFDTQQLADQMPQVIQLI